MKIHDFGLWFNPWGLDRGIWSTKIPEGGGFSIYYDTELLGWQHSATQTSLMQFCVKINETGKHIINFKNNFIMDNDGYYDIGRLLTIDDFEIIPNPDYKEIL